MKKIITDAISNTNGLPLTRKFLTFENEREKNHARYIYDKLGVYDFTYQQNYIGLHNSNNFSNGWVGVNSFTTEDRGSVVIGGYIYEFVPPASPITITTTADSLVFVWVDSFENAEYTNGQILPTYQERKVSVGVNVNGVNPANYAIDINPYNYQRRRIEGNLNVQDALIVAPYILEKNGDFWSLSMNAIDNYNAGDRVALANGIKILNCDCINDSGKTARVSAWITDAGIEKPWAVDVFVENNYLKIKGITGTSNNVTNWHIHATFSI